MHIPDIKLSEIEGLEVVPEGIGRQTQQQPADHHAHKDPDHAPAEADLYPHLQRDKEFGEEEQDQEDHLRSV